MVNQIYPSELQLNKPNTSDTEAMFLDLHLSSSNDIVSTKIYQKSEVKWTKDFQNHDIVWELAYQMSHRCTIDMKLRNFQYKIKI